MSVVWHLVVSFQKNGRARVLNKFYEGPNIETVVPPPNIWGQTRTIHVAGWATECGKMCFVTGTSKNKKRWRLKFNSSQCRWRCFFTRGSNH